MKTKILLLVLILFLSNFVLFAQNPEWQWAIQAGGNGNEWIDDWGYAISNDGSGNSYIAGWFTGNASFGTHSLSSNGYQDIFVAKFDSDGDCLWAINAGGSYGDRGYGITLDDYNNIYITGFFSGDASFGTHTLFSDEYPDTFVAKFNSDGDCLWAKNAVGPSDMQGRDIAIDNFGNAYITGWFNGNISFGTHSLSTSGYNDYDIFIAKIDENGNWQWAKQAGGNSYDKGYGISVDNNGNSYVTGYCKSTAIFGPYTLYSNGIDDYEIFVTKLDENGNWLWAVQGGGDSIDNGFKIISNNENCYLTGYFSDTAVFGSYTLISYGDEDIFTAKIDENGNWQWVTQAGGNSSDKGYGISVDNNGNSYVTGTFMDTATFGAYSLANNGANDIFVAKLDVNGNISWVTNAGGSYDEIGYGITLDDYDNIYITGYFAGLSIFGSNTLTSIGETDIYVAKLGFGTSAEHDLVHANISLLNYPNPFNPTTTISFSTQNDSQVELSIFNMKGQKVKTLAQNEFTKGSHSIIWNGDTDSGQSVSSGIYYYKLNVNGKTEVVKKCLLLK